MWSEVSLRSLKRIDVDWSRPVEGLKERFRTWKRMTIYLARLKGFMLARLRLSIYVLAYRGLMPRLWAVRLIAT